jgi:hypothetical protein
LHASRIVAFGLFGFCSLEVSQNRAVKLADLPGFLVSIRVGVGQRGRSARLCPKFLSLCPRLLRGL